jgi:hypothetical protein
MTQAGPRNSILDLFDPLKTPSRPPSPDSDKENASPRDREPTLTAYFNRTYSKQDTKASLSPKLTRRLIDVGDATVDNISSAVRKTWNGGDREVRLNDNEQLPQHEIRLPSPRTPLADIPPEHCPQLIARQKVYRREELRLSAPPLPIVRITPAPEDTSLSTSSNRAEIHSQVSAITPPVPSFVEPSSTAHLAPSSTPSLLLGIPPPRSASPSEDVTLSSEPQITAEQSASFSCMDVGSFDLLNAQMDIGSGSGLGMDSDLFFNLSGIESVFDKSLKTIEDRKRNEDKGNISNYAHYTLRAI